MFTPTLKPSQAINVANLAHNKKGGKQLETNGKRSKKDGSTGRDRLKTAES